MLSKVGATPEHRLILGHHSLKSFGSLEMYARDVQAAPLRTLCRMLQDMFCPDATGSGLVLDEADILPSHQVDATGTRSLPSRQC